MDENNVYRDPSAPQHEQEWQRPFAPHVEIGMRSRHILIVGVMLVIGFLAPVLTMKPVYTSSYGSSCGMVSMDSEFRFANVSSAFGGGSHWLERVLALTPLLAGAGAILLAHFVTSGRRGWGLVGLWAIPIVATLVFIIGAMMSDPMLGRLGGSVIASGAGSTAGYTVLALSAGMLAVFVGARARWYRPASRAAFWIGRVGGALFVVGLLVPVLPKSDGLVPLLLPFRLMSFGGIFVWLGFWLMVSMGLMVAAAVVCFGTGTDIHPQNAHDLAGRAFAFWKSSALVFGTAVVLAVMWTIKCSLGMLPVVFFGGIQLACCGVAWWLLLPFGVTDLVVGEPTLVASGAPGASVEVPPPADGPRDGAPAVDPFHAARPTTQKDLGRVEIPDADPFHVAQPWENETEAEPAETSAADARDAAPATTLPPEVRGKLVKLEEFRDAGLLTTEEFEKRRDALLGATADARG